MDSVENSEHLPLGKNSAYPSCYDPKLLFPIKRPTRTELNSKFGFDRWISYEFTWLSSSGCPKCCGLEIIIPANSKFIVESKSLKLYLSGFAQEKYSGTQKVLETIRKDLCKTIENDNIEIKCLELDSPCFKISDIKAELIDNEEIICNKFNDPCKETLQVSAEPYTKKLYSNIFRSLCPVTRQPDYATILIDYSGKKINTESLLRYLVSYRNHSGFHETCCEKIFEDILLSCRPDNLTVACYFNRRGGIDINPLRSTSKVLPLEYYLRCSRQ